MRINGTVVTLAALAALSGVMYICFDGAIHMFNVGWCGAFAIAAVFDEME